MRMLSPPVLAGAVLASSPALYQGFVTRAVPLEQAGSRFLVALVIAWLAMSAVAMLVGEPPKPIADGAPGADPAVPLGVDATPPRDPLAPVDPAAPAAPIAPVAGELPAGESTHAA